MKKEPQSPQNWWSRAHFSCSRFTLRLSSAASNFFWISSNDTSFFFGGDRGNSGTASFERGLRISSKACPEARFSSSFTWISAKAGGKSHKNEYFMQKLAQVTSKTAFQKFSTMEIPEEEHPRQEFCFQHSNTVQKRGNFLCNPSVILHHPST